MLEFREEFTFSSSAIRDIIEIANREEFLTGYCRLDEPFQKRVTIYFDKKIVGFLSPRREGNHWRIGATYICPEFRKRKIGYSLAELAYIKYLRGLPILEVVDKENLASKSFLWNCGFRFVCSKSDTTEVWSNISPNATKGASKVTDLPVLDRDKLTDALQKLEKWNFELAKEKLLEPSYAGWSVERANSAEENYKRYLAVTVALNGFQLVPNGDIDRFWHEHILDTRRYEKDCVELFGEFLHHYPYFGMRGKSDNTLWENTADISNRIWNEAFGENLYSYSTPHTRETDNVTTEINSTKEDDMTVSISITINVNGKGVTTKVGAEDLSATPMKCPQACPNPGTGMNSVATDAMKCPQACPNPGTGRDALAADAMKCPQACPNPATTG